MLYWIQTHHYILRNAFFFGDQKKKKKKRNAFDYKHMKWSVPVYPIISQNRCLFLPWPRSLMAITFPFLHLCIICPGRGQSVTSIHPAASLQPAANWWDNKHSEVPFVGINSIKLQWLEIVCCDVSLAVYRFVCFFNFHSCYASIKPQIQCLWPGEVGEQPYISREGLR